MSNVFVLQEEREQALLFFTLKSMGRVDCSRPNFFYLENNREGK